MSTILPFIEPAPNKINSSTSKLNALKNISRSKNQKYKTIDRTEIILATFLFDIRQQRQKPNERPNLYWRPIYLATNLYWQPGIYRSLHQLRPIVSNSVGNSSWSYRDFHIFPFPFPILAERNILPGSDHIHKKTHILKGKSLESHQNQLLQAEIFSRKRLVVNVFQVGQSPATGCRVSMIVALPGSPGG